MNTLLLLALYAQTFDVAGFDCGRVARATLPALWVD
jgi:hypothetical protein